jgi:iron complex outermembrane receptor protein
MKAQKTAMRRLGVGPLGGKSVEQRCRRAGTAAGARHHDCPGRSVLPQAAKTLLRLAILMAVALPAWPQQKTEDLTSKSLEDLMNIEVTSVSKKEQKLSRTASAVFVITHDDIRHSGATNIPDLLRMVPGMDVAQINSNTWAITTRGFNGEFSNELLVMVDGRTVYLPTFGGVFWDVLDVPLENIDRIEVIRGPGGAIWGANAVNGVINIITKKASETRGALLSAGGGTYENGFGTAQYGGKLGSKTDYRVYTSYFNRDHLPDAATGKNGHDDWHMLRGGFRFDSNLSPKDTLMVQGDSYSGGEGKPTIFLPSIISPTQQDTVTLVNASGDFLQSVWNHVYSSRSDTTLQVSFDHYQSNYKVSESRSTISADFQHHFAWGERQNVVWGLGYRFSTSDTTGNLSVSLNPPNLNTQTFSGFFQDEISLIPDRLYLTLGTKIEHNYFTGLVAMPSVRVAWSPTGRQMFWAAVSKADRTPASVDTHLRVNFGGFPGQGGIPVLLSLLGNPHFKNEGLIAFEAGYRRTVLDNLSFDFAAFYNSYSNQQTTEPGTPFLESSPAPPHLVFPITYQNLMHGETHGFEIASNWKPTRRWTLSPGFALERIHLHTEAASRDTSTVPDEGTDTPRQSAQLRSHLDMPRRLAWDVSTYFVDRLKSGAIPSYTRLDTQLTWHWNERTSFTVVGQNLLKDLHLEFIDIAGAARSAEIKRSVYAKFTWQF